MQSIAFAAPLLPGKTELELEGIRSCAQGERKAAFEESRRRRGIVREAAWLQRTSAGDMTVVYLEAEDLQAAFQGLGSSQEPFDVWFREHVRQVNGINLEDGFPPPEQLIDYRGEPAGSTSGTADVAGASS
jgi:hypothetical protein